MALSRDEVERILAEDRAAQQERTEAILGSAGVEPRKPGRPAARSAKVAAYREHARQLRAAQEAAKPPEPFRLRPLIEQATAKRVRPEDAVAAVLKRIPFQHREDALRAAILVCCRMVSGEHNPGGEW